MEHSFNIKLATELESTEKAVLLKNIDFWITKNAVNKKHFINGKYWTYNSVSAFNKLFPYLKEKTITRCLKQLEEDGYLESSKLSKDKRDRTKWYTLTEKYYCICPNEQMSLPKRANVYKEQIVNTDTTNVETEVPTPDNKKNETTNIGMDGLVGEQETLFDLQTKLLEDNARLLRHLPKTVLGKKVSYEEIKALIAYVEKFNEIRQNYFSIIGENKSIVTPNAKAIRQFIELFRYGNTIDDIEEVIYNIFESAYHKENKYFHVTLEFVVRHDIWQKYRDVA